MAITSIVALAEHHGDREDVETPFIQDRELTLNNQDWYPASERIDLVVRDQPFPLTEPPTFVLPTIVRVRVSYGAVGFDPDAAVPEERLFLVPEIHPVRELIFQASYAQRSWRVEGFVGRLYVNVGVGLRGDVPDGAQAAANLDERVPSFPFVARMNVKALCVWTRESPPLLEWIRSNVLGPFVHRQDPRKRAPHP